MSKLMINQAFDMDYDQILPFYFKLQERAQFSLDVEEANRHTWPSAHPIGNSQWKILFQIIPTIGETRTPVFIMISFQTFIRQSE